MLEWVVSEISVMDMRRQGEASGSVPKEKWEALLKAEMLCYMNDVIISEKVDYYMLKSKLEDMRRKEVGNNEALMIAEMENATVFEKVRYLVTIHNNNNDKRKIEALSSCLEVLKKSIDELEGLLEYV